MPYSGEKLQTILQDQGRRIYWLAEQSDVSPSLLYRIMKLQRPLTADVAARIADVLDMPIEALEADDRETANV